MNHIDDNVAEQILQKLDDQGKILNDHGRILNDHSEMLNAQGKMLSDQGKILNDHSRILNAQGKTLNEHTTMLNDHSTILNGHGGMLGGHGAKLEEHSQAFLGLGVMMENLMEQNHVILETIHGMQKKVARIPAIEADIEVLKRDMKAVKMIQFKTTARVDDHEIRIGRLEEA